MDDRLDAAAGPAQPGRAGRRDGPVERWLTTAWCLVAGALLAVAPRAAATWETGLLEVHPRLHDVLATAAARWGISAFGFVLLAVGAWDVSRFIVEELT